MSQENVESVKRVIDGYNRRDLDDFDDLLTSDYEWSPALVRGLEGGSYRGREGIETYFAEVRDTWEENRTVPGEFRDLGDRVLMLGRMEGRGKGSGAPVDAPLGIVFDFRDEKVSRARSYLDHDEALRAAGLAEKGR
jgi:ketosteroid isomerase-like protein